VFGFAAACGVAAALSTLVTAVCGAATSFDAAAGGDNGGGATATAPDTAGLVGNALDDPTLGLPVLKSAVHCLWAHMAFSPISCPWAAVTSAVCFEKPIRPARLLSAVSPDKDFNGMLLLCDPARSTLPALVRSSK
jgi:hypothetical protein